MRNASFLVDGQFGSTGKGLVASAMAQHDIFGGVYDIATTNAGPNSGHTSYFGLRKIVLQQLPTYAVHSHLLGRDCVAYINAGAVIDKDILIREAWEFPGLAIFVHPNAAVIDSSVDQSDIKDRIGSTGKGVGTAIQGKISRNERWIYRSHHSSVVQWAPNVRMGVPEGMREKPTLVEVAQGFSLGINTEFYPYCTSRSCTVAQAMADADLHPSQLSQTVMVVRTYPIRVAGNSGSCYPDQNEISWDAIGREPEITTVTKKPRRIFTWSDIQFKEALAANQPDIVFVNFMNYLNEQEDEEMRSRVERLTLPFGSKLMYGYGPTTQDLSY